MQGGRTIWRARRALAAGSLPATVPELRVQPFRSLLFDRAFDWFFSAFVFVTVFLPGGTVYGVNFKYPLYAGLLPLAAYRFFRNGQAQPSQVALLLLAPAVLAGWALLGVSNSFGTAGVVRQYTDILLTLLLCWLATVFCNGQGLRRLRLLRLVLYASVWTAALKIGLIAYAVLRGIPVVQMVTWLDQVFGVELMTMDLGSLFGRVQFISDELIPLCIFTVLRHRDRLRIGNLRASLIILILLVSVLFSFSRYFWGFTACAFVFGLLLGRRDRFQAVLSVVLGLAVLASLPALVAVYQLRFSTTVAGGSDLSRSEQIPALQQFFVQAPLFGHGLGSYTTAVLRTDVESGRHSYEVQLLALPAQIGLVGIAFLLALGVYYYRDLWWHSTLAWQDRAGLWFLLACWIAAGFTNPLLFHPIAGINYATIATLAGLGRGSAAGRLGSLPG